MIITSTTTPSEMESLVAAEIEQAWKTGLEERVKSVLVDLVVRQLENVENAAEENGEIDISELADSTLDLIVDSLCYGDGFF